VSEPERDRERETDGEREREWVCAQVVVMIRDCEGVCAIAHMQNTGRVCVCGRVYSGTNTLTITLHTDNHTYHLSR